MRDWEVKKIIDFTDTNHWKNQKGYTYYDILKIKVKIIDDLISQPEQILSSLDTDVDEMYPDVELQDGEVIDI